MFVKSFSAVCDHTKQAKLFGDLTKNCHYLAENRPVFKKRCTMILVQNQTAPPRQETSPVLDSPFRRCLPRMSSRFFPYKKRFTQFSRPLSRTFNRFPRQSFDRLNHCLEQNNAYLGTSLSRERRYRRFVLHDAEYCWTRH